MKIDKAKTIKPYVSLIVPVYNVEKYIAECVESLINQTLDNIQIIFVDDRSTDSSMQIVYQYAENDPRIITFEFEVNTGPATARNFGLSRSLGEYVQFIDADDIVPKDAVKRLYEAAKKQNADLVRGNGVYFDEEDPNIEYPMQNITQVKDSSGLSYCNTNFHGNPWYHPLFQFRRKFLIENNILYPNLRLGEDPVFLLEALVKAQNTSTISDIVYKYRTGLERTDHFENEAKVADYFEHLILLKDMWVSSNMQTVWEEYFNSTFWWPWEKYLVMNSDSIKKSFPSIKLIFDSLSYDYISSLDGSRAIYMSLVKYGDSNDVSLYANKFNSSLNVTASDTNSGATELERQAIYEELVNIYTSRSWKSTRIFRKLYKKIENRKYIRQLKSSEHFNAEWYLDEYPDVANSGMSPEKHYLIHGWKEGRNPSSTFSTTKYLMTRKYVKDKGLNPLIHYINCSI